MNEALLPGVDSLAAHAGSSVVAVGNDWGSTPADALCVFQEYRKLTSCLN